MEQEFEQRRNETTKECHVDFHSKTDAALLMYK
jgi:hypothetical protein